jgi:hypothetical protein
MADNSRRREEKHEHESCGISLYAHASLPMPRIRRHLLIARAADILKLRVADVADRY